MHMHMHMFERAHISNWLLENKGYGTPSEWVDVRLPNAIVDAFILPRTFEQLPSHSRARKRSCPEGKRTPLIDMAPSYSYRGLP